MSKAKKIRKPAWEEVSHEVMGESARLVSRQPVSRVPALARPGMICMPSGTSRYAVIELMTKEIAIVRFESGRPEAYFWGEIELAAVQPDPRYTFVSKPRWVSINKH